MTTGNRTLKQAGFDRADLVISDLEEGQEWDSPEEAGSEEALVQTKASTAERSRPSERGARA